MSLLDRCFTRPTRALLASSWIRISAAAIILVACADDTTGPARSATPAPSAQRVGVSAEPFYYYQGERIPLVVDPTRLIVAGTPSQTAETIRTAVGSVGVQVASMERLPQVADHWMLRLASGTTPAAAQSAAARLKTQQRFRFASPVFKTVDGGYDFAPFNRVIVKFKKNVTVAQIDRLNATLGTQIVRVPQRDSNFVGYWLEYPADPATDPLEIAALLDRHPLVEWADPDKVSDRRPQAVPSDTYYSLQFHLNNTNTRNGIPVDINAEAAWDLTLGSSTIHVAVIDDGVDWLQTEIDWDNGYDAFWPNVQPGESEYQPFGNDTHGTSVAGIIEGAHNNGGIAGVAPNVRINIGRIFRYTYPPSGSTQAASDGQIANVINWAWNNNGVRSDVINNSWGGGAPSNAITAAINDAITYGRDGKGTVVVFAAGNTSNRDNGIIGYVPYPATLSAVITVGAINRFGNITNYSAEGNSTRAIDVLAPSGHYTDSCVGEVVTTDRAGSAGCNDGPNGDVNFTQTFSGTSAAAPQVSGVAALLLSREPQLTAAQVKSRIINTADDWGSPVAQFGNGKLNAHSALAPLGVSISGSSYIASSGSYTWTANRSGGTGSYSYQWEISYNDGGTWHIGSSSQTQSLYVQYGDPGFSLRVNVTSGTQTAGALRGVVVEGGCGGLGCFSSRTEGSKR